MTDREKLKEEIKSELETELLTKITARKRAEHAWTKAKNRLFDEYNKIYKSNTRTLINSAAAIGRVMLNHNTVKTFTDSDINTVESLMNELVAVCEKYKQSEAVRQ